MKKIAVSILNWNDAERTIQCVRSLRASRFTDFDTFIVDNGSKPEEAQVLETTLNTIGVRSHVSVHRNEENRGFAAGHNDVLKRIAQDDGYTYALLLNNDATVEPDTLGRLLEYMETHPTVAVAGPMVLQPNGCVESLGARINLYTGKIVSLQKGTPPQDNDVTPKLVDVVIGNCFFVRMKAVKEIGLLDEMYFAYYEESDWCLRARNIRWKCAVVPTAVITHAKAGGFRTFLITRNMIWFEKKNASVVQLFCFFFVFWFWYIPERIKKGSPLRELASGSMAGWLNLRTKHNFL